MELNIEKFNPTKAELLILADKAKWLEIKGVDDKEGYQAVHKQRIELKNARVEITKIGKALRADALAFQKAVIEKEKELVGIIEPAELELEAKQNAIDEEKERNKRVALLPERHQKLADINIAVPDDVLLGMDDNQFQEYLNNKHAEFLAEQARKQQEEQARIDAENKRIADEKRLEEAKKEAAEKALQQAAKDAELAKLKAEQEKEAAVKAERERIEKEQKAKEEAEARKIVQEKAEQESLEKEKKYQEFLKDNGYTEETKQEFYIAKNGGVITLYKKVADYF